MHFDIVTYYLLKNIKYFDKLTVNNLTVSSKGTLNITPTSLSDLSEIVNKEYVDRVVSSYGVLYYMYDEIDTETGYKFCKLEPPSSAETYIEKTGLVNGDYIDGWISPSDNTPDRLLKGIYNWNITLEKTGGTKTLRVYWKLIERKLDGTEIEIATSSLSNEITSKATFTVPLQLNDDYILSEGSRIVVKIYANVNGSGNAPAIKVYYQGNTSSRWEIPVDLKFYASIFLPLDTDLPIDASISENQWLFVATSGIVGLPKQSACKAYLNTSQLIPTDTYTLVNIDTVVFDAQNEFDTTQHRFTATEDGNYVILGKLRWYGPEVVADKIYETAIYKNGTIVASEISHASFAEYISSCVYCCLWLSAGDYVELYALQRSGGDVSLVTGASYTTFEIIKVA